MLRAEDAKRVELVQREKHYKQKIYIFSCACGKDLRVQGQGLARHSGKCLRCSRRKGHKYQTLFNGMKTSVQRTNERFGRTVPFNLSFEEFLVFTDINCCRYCGGGIEWREWRPGPYNLDRLDNSKGYEIGNLAVCCFGCNHRKNKFYTADEFSAISDFLRVWRGLDSSGRQELLYTVISWNDTWEDVQ